MCGICGVWPGKKEDKVRAMVSAMHHRGPDDRGIFSDERVTLGMTRLAILDITANGHQPMASEDGNIWIVYNGETYNFIEHKKLLEKSGVTFKSDSDTEVVLRLYEKYGDDFLKQLRGMFALAIYDKRRGPGRERLLLARDQLGIKPLLYTGDARHFIFASELKALLASDLIKPEINTDALHGLLAYGSITQPSTILSGVKMLMPGHRLTIDSGCLSIERFWSLDVYRLPEVSLLRYDDQVRRLRETMEDTVRAHMVSDVPVGAFLSGGIDSTILVSLMSRMSRHKVRTFSVGFGKEGEEIDETDDAAGAAAFLDTDHTRVIVTGREVREEILDIAGALDQPSVDGVNSYFVSAAAAGKVKVAISGTGGDELFAGYPWFSAMAQAAQKYQNSNPWMKIKQFASRFASIEHFDNIQSDFAARLLSRIRASGDLLEFFARQYQIFGAHRARYLFVPEVARALVHTSQAREHTARADELNDATILSRVSALCLRGYTQNQLLRDIDAVSMKHSLEVRVPFIDRVLADLALSLPDETKLGTGAIQNTSIACRNTGAKRILIDSVRDLLPQDLDLRPKRGFAMPFGAWLFGPLREVIDDTLCDRSVESRGLFKISAVKAIRHQFYQGNGNWALPWLLMMIELWFRQVIDPVASSYSTQSI
jgi:asparagine synthase (glutamine-hydrolysing)